MELIEGDGKTWLKYYGKLIDKVDFIDLNEKNVVLSGNHPVYYKLPELGANVKNDSRLYNYGGRSGDRVTKATDYLFVEPYSSGYGKAETVIDLRKAGNTRVKVILADDLDKLIKSGHYYSKEMAEKDAKKRAEELKAKIDAELTENKLGYGALAIMMTIIKILPEDAMNLKDRLVIEELLISQPLESLLGTHLKDLLTVYESEATEKLTACARYVKSEISSFEKQIDNIRESFGNSIQAVDAFLDIVMDTIKEA